MLIAAGSGPFAGSDEITLSFQLPGSAAGQRLRLHRPAVLSDAVRLPHRLRQQGLWGLDLLGEIDETFSSDMRAILDSGRQHTTWLLCDGAALRHCCRLLYEIEAAAAAGLELSVRMLGRAHMEAWLVALFIHFGGYEALLKVAQDARHSLEGIELEARQFDEWLAAGKTAARKSGMRVAKTNSGIAQWNEKNPDVPPKPLLDEPYVPQLSSTGLDLSSLIEGFGSHSGCSGLPFPLSPATVGGHGWGVRRQAGRA